MEIMFNPRQWQLGQIEEIEEYTKLTIGEVFRLLAKGNTPAKLITWLVWQELRKDNAAADIGMARRVDYGDVKLVYPKVEDGEGKA